MVEIEDIKRRINKIEKGNEKTDDRYVEIQKDLVEIKLMLNSDIHVEKRVMKLEQNQAKLFGGVAVFVLLLELAPYIIDIFTKV